MARLTQSLALLALLPAFTGVAHAGTLIDSFTKPLPPNGYLQNTLRPILFLGSQCDGVTCPPAPVVTITDDQVYLTQEDVPGALSPYRASDLARRHPTGPLDQGVLRIDPANGGSMVVEGASGAGLFAVEQWGDFAHPLNWDLLPDGSDHFEIDILDAASAPNAIHFWINIFSSSTNGASREWYADGPGTISIPYSAIPDFAATAHDIDAIGIVVDIPAGTPPPIVVGEFRTAGSTSPTVPQSWGRIKNAYRR